MDINDPRYRLKVLNQSNPSVRIAVSPQQPTPSISQPSQPQNISISAPAPLPNITVPQSNPGPSSPAQNTWAVPQAPKQGWFGKAVSSVINPVSKFGNDVAALGALIQPNRAGIAARINQANKFTAPGGGLGSQGGVLGGDETNSNDAIFLGPNAKQNIEKTVGEGGQLASMLIGGGEGSAAKAVIGGGAAGAIGSSGNQLATTGTINPKQLGIDTLFGGALGAAGKGVSSVVSNALDRVNPSRVVGRLADEISNANTAADVTAKLPGLDASTANFLAGESNPNVVSAVLHQSADNAGIPIKDWIQNTKVGNANATDLNNPDAQINGTFDNANPPQSALPAGMHAPNAPDPVQTLIKQVNTAKSPEDFASAVSRLTGEDRAAAESALNGMKPEDFYNAVKGDTNTPAYQRGYGQTQPAPQVAKTPSAAETAFQEKQSALRETGVPAYERQGNQALFDAMVNHIQTGKIVDDTTYLKESKALSSAYDKEIAGLQGKGDQVTPAATDAIDQKYQAAKAELDANHERTTAMMKLGQNPQDEVAAAKLSNVAPAPKTPASGTAEAAPKGDLADTTPAPADTTAPVANTSDVTPGSPADTVLQKLDEASKLYNPEARAFSKQRGAALYRGEAAAQATGGVEGHFANLGQLKGVKKQSGFQPIEVDKGTQDSLINQIYQNDSLLPGEKLNAASALLKVFGVGDGGTPTPGDVNYLRKALGNDVADAVDQNVKLAGPTTRERIAMVAATPKAAMATADLSAPLRQGGVLGARFPKEWASNVADSAKFFASEQNFKNAMDQIKARPNFSRYEEMGLHVEAANESTGTEEALQNSLLQTKAAKKALVGIPAMAADRGYSGFLTKLRADVADNILGNLDKAGVWDEMSTADKKSLGKFINTASGRGDLGSLERHAGLLSKALFSPRLWKSRLDLLNPVYYAKLSGPARKYALQTSGAFAGIAGSVLGLAAAAGADVIWDPRSADFAKIKVGNTRYDILGGLQQNIRLGAQMITGEKIDSQTGQVATLGPNRGFGKPSRKDLLYQFFENKENPLVSYATKALEGTDAAGNPVNLKTEGAKLLIPLNFQDVYSTGQDVGNYGKGAAMAIPGFFGAGVQTYGQTPTKDQGKPTTNGTPTYTGKVAPNMVTDAQGNVLTNAKGDPVTVKFTGKETDAEKQAMLVGARKNALKTTAEGLLSPADQQTYIQGTKDPSVLNDAQKSKFDQIKKWVTTYGEPKTAPAGVKSDLATQVYQKYNSMDANDQKYWLSDKNPPEQAAVQITQQLNQQKSKGLSDWQPSNALAKLYADYEKDSNTHNYDVVDQRNKAKAFQVAATKLQSTQPVNSIYNEGGSADLKTLIANGKINKPDLDNAIALDNQLYASGLTSSLKFSKTFRNAYGYGVPSTYGSGGSSSSGGSSGSSSTNKGPTAAQVTALIPSGNPNGSKTGTTSGLPQFSSRARSQYIPNFKSISLPQYGSLSPLRGETVVSSTRPTKATIKL